MNSPLRTGNQKSLRTVLTLLGLVLSALGLAACAWPGGSPKKQTIVPTPTATFQTGAPLPAGLISLPPGFSISVFTQGLDQPRMLTIGPDRQLYLAERGAGRIVRLPDLDQDGKVDEIQVVAAELAAPSSLAFFKDGSLYVSETTRVLRLSSPDAQGAYQKRETIIADLPDGGHTTRTLIFSPDWQKLYVSIGSSCNVCFETDARRATIMQYNPDGSAGQIFAQGLRNAVGLAFRPGADQLWATNNGRDQLGDDLPPDTIQIVHQGQDFGWPGCHAGRIADPEYGSSGSCKAVAPPAVELQAHSAPLGLAFYTGAQFPTQYQGNLFVALHGSWNRSQPTGYKIVRIQFFDGNRPGPVQDFATGWLQDDSAWGRPVDLITAADGSLLVSDDEGGIIYRITYNK